jgi:hypothetical protein
MDYLNRDDVKTLRNEIDAALAIVSAKYGVTISLGNFHFNSSEARVKLTVSTIMNRPASTINTNVESVEITKLLATKEGQDYAMFGPTVGLPDNSIGKMFTVQGREFQIVGLKLNRYKYPVTGVGSHGGRYKFTVKQVVDGLIN